MAGPGGVIRVETARTVGDRSTAPLGDLVRDKRRRAGWTQEQLAVAAGVSVAVVQNLEQGVSKRPRQAAMQRISAVLDLPVVVPEVCGPPADGRALASPEDGLVVDSEPLGQGGALPKAAAGGRGRLRFELFGPLRAWGGGSELALGGARRKAVLGLLLLQPGAVVSAVAIAEALWDAGPPSTATAMIQTYISRLRAALSPAEDGRGPVIETAGASYRLRGDGVDIDLADSQALMARARRALMDGDAGRACELFETALVPWGRGLLADVDVLRGHPALVRAEQDGARAVVEYAEAAAARGWHERVLPHLEALAARDPLNERAHACLMVALAGSGQQAAALDVYDRLRRRLDEELGVLPGAALVGAHARVLRHEIVPSAHAGGGAAAGAPLAAGDTAPGSAQRETPPSRLPGGAAAADRAAAPGPAAPGSGSHGAADLVSAASEASPVPFQLPPAVADFTGRAGEIAALREWLVPAAGEVGVPVAVICGPPGAGKTALMLRVGHALREAFPDGQLWAHLAAGASHPRDPAEVLGEWLRALGVHGSAIPEQPGERAALFRSLLAGRRVLAVIDDAGSAAQVEPLLPGTAGCAAVVTSRRRLAELAGARVLPLGPFSGGDAAGLLGRILGEDRVRAQAKAAGDLVAACGGLPLAVRVAGARLASRPQLPIAALAAALTRERHRLDLLRAGEVSVRASIASGYGALSSRARQAFRLLGLLGPGDVAEWVIHALLGGPADAVVDELTDRCMLAMAGVDIAGQARFRLHDLLRDYAAEQAAAGPEAETRAALERAHQAWLQLAWLASTRLSPEPFFPRWQPDTVPQVLPDDVAQAATANPLAWFAAERLNLIAVADRACAAGNYQYATQLTLCQAAFHHLQERHDDATRLWTRIAAAASDAADSHTTAIANLRLVGAMVERGYAAQTLELARECAEQLEGTGDLINLAFALYWHGSCLFDCGHFPQAKEVLERGVRCAQACGDLHAEFLNLRALGITLGQFGDHAASIDACQRALQVVGQLGEQSFAQHALHNLAYCCTLAGEQERTIELCLRRRDLCRAEGDVRGEAMSLALLGDALYALGRYQDAIDAYRQALPVFRRHFIKRHGALCAYKLGRAYQAIGDHQRAVQLLEEGLNGFKELDLARFEGWALGALRECQTVALA